MKIILLKIFILVFLTYLGFHSCTERLRENPLDPKVSGDPKLILSVLSFNDRIELSWNSIKMTDFTGFNVYRKNHPDSSFILIAENILPGNTSFTDIDIRYHLLHSYYITIQGESSESSPSNTISITPGRGYNWIVDKWGYQIFKITYDAQYSMERYYTDWTPQDIAIDPERNVALITQPIGKRMDIIETSEANLITMITSNNHSFIYQPYLVEFEPSTKMFWVSDSGGSVYRISSSDYSVHFTQSEITKPDEIFVHSNEGIVYIIDDNSNHIYRYDLNGNFVNRFSNIDNYIFSNPKKIVFDSVDNQFWLIDTSNDIDYLYTGFINNMQISLIDTFDHVFNIHLNPNDQTSWISVFEDGIYKILQLSKAGSRQLELTGFYKPNHVTHNPYDGTLLVTDSGNRRIVHYKENFEILGIFTNLNTPLRLEVE